MDGGKALQDEVRHGEQRDKVWRGEEKKERKAVVDQLMEAQSRGEEDSHV